MNYQVNDLYKKKKFERETLLDHGKQPNSLVYIEIWQLWADFYKWRFCHVGHMATDIAIKNTYKQTLAPLHMIIVVVVSYT